MKIRITGLLTLAFFLNSCGSAPEPQSAKPVARNSVNSDVIADDDQNESYDDRDSTDSDDDLNDVVERPEDDETVVDNNVVPAIKSAKWHSLLLTGDNSINAFDNAREKIGSLLVSAGVAAQNILNLSVMAKKINGSSVKKTSLAQIEDSLKGVGQDDRCFVHMTSHGSRTGFYLVNQGEISPTELDGVLNRTCGSRPTVLLISACYSGIFSNSSAMRKPNRIILTAARPDRTSFGCGAENQYTYWDSCLIESMTKVKSWNDLYTTTTACVRRKEQGGFTPSEPQLYIGDQVKDLPYIF
ncbi:MAG: hypothetical protein NT027_13385 [Proteobacteria bacterium]|nr:hypothetical protein [Pseudomonadota bacterium]